MTTSPATLQLLQTLAAFSPRGAQAPRKPTFKMAKLANPDASGSDRSAGWGGDCGLFHELGVEVFLKVLEHCPLHSRLVPTEFTNKSFRMMRLEPELFSTLRLHHCDSVKLTAQLKSSVRDKDAIFCPASHFANLLHAKQLVLYGWRHATDGHQGHNQGRGRTASLALTARRVLRQLDR